MAITTTAVIITR